MASSGTYTLARDASCALPGLAWLSAAMGDRERKRGLSPALLLVGGGVKHSSIPPAITGMGEVEETP